MQNLAERESSLSCRSFGEVGGSHKVAGTNAFAGLFRKLI